MCVISGVMVADIQRCQFFCKLIDRLRVEWSGCFKWNASGSGLCGVGNIALNVEKSCLDKNGEN